MKKLIVLIGAVMLALSASAQIHWNVKVAGGVSHIIGSETYEDEYPVTFKVGAGFEKRLVNNLFLMPTVELGYFRSSNYRGSHDFKRTSVNIPIDLGCRFRVMSGMGLLLVKAGPYFSYGDTKAYEDHCISAEKDFDCGINAGIGLELRKAVIGLEWDIGLTKVAEFHDCIGLYKNNFYLSLGYKF